MDLSDRASQPPRWAIRLITLVGPSKEGEAALGDLLEEFCFARQRLGSSRARRWFWYQAFRTVAYLVGREFRRSPLTIVGVAVCGFVLRWYVSRLYHPVLADSVDALLRHYEVYELDPRTYIFWTIHIFYAERFLANVLTGIFVAIVAKRREMSAVLALAILGDLLAIASVVGGTVRTGDTGLLWTLPWSFAFSLAVIAGGAFVRLRRSPSIKPTLKQA